MRVSITGPGTTLMHRDLAVWGLVATIQNVRDLDTIFSWAKSDVRELFGQQINISFFLIFICGLYKCPIHLQLDKTQKCVKYFRSG